MWIIKYTKRRKQNKAYIMYLLTITNKSKNA